MQTKEPVRDRLYLGDEIIHALTQDAQKRHEINYLTRHPNLAAEQDLSAKPIANGDLTADLLTALL